MDIVLEAGTCDGSPSMVADAIHAVGKLQRDGARYGVGSTHHLALKVQLLSADTIVDRTATRYDRTGGPAATQHELFANVIPYSNWGELFAMARDQRVEMFATPFDMGALQFLADIGVDTVKIASGDITYHQLISEAGRLFPNVIISTGASTVGEVEMAVEAVRKSGWPVVTLLACHLAYPTPRESANLARVRELQHYFPHQRIGYSDHTPGTETIAPLAFMGANMIEKHFSVARPDVSTGDHQFAVRPSGVMDMLGWLHEADVLLGDSELCATEMEMHARIGARRSAHARFGLDRGHVISETDIVWLRPAPPNSIEPYNVDKLIGRELAAPVGAGEIIDTRFLKPGGRAKASGTLSVE